MHSLFNKKGHFPVILSSMQEKEIFIDARHVGKRIDILIAELSDLNARRCISSSNMIS